MTSLTAKEPTMTTAASTVVPVTDEQIAWTQTRAQLLAFVSRRVESPDAAEDIVQDVLERIQSTDLSAVANLQAWLYRAARNAIVDHYRGRRATVSLDDDLVQGWGDFEENGEPISAVQELARCLRPLIDELPAEYGSAVTLVDLDGQTHHAAAQAAGISTSGMKSRVQRGRKKLAVLLQDCCAIETTARGGIIDYAPRDGGCSC
jgi:RNA polymerase sigma-70 factor (ECF subfamily)